MGGGIAALAASAGIPVVLLDVPATGGDRNATVARRPRARSRSRSRPRSWTPSRASADRDRQHRRRSRQAARDCDLVIEAIIEQAEPKRALYERLETTSTRSHDRRVEHVGHPDDDAARGTLDVVPVGASSACTSSTRRDICTCSRSFRPRRRRKETIDAARRFSESHARQGHRRREGRPRFRREPARRVRDGARHPAHGEARPHDRRSRRRSPAR